MYRVYIFTTSLRIDEYPFFIRKRKALHSSTLGMENAIRCLLCVMRSHASYIRRVYRRKIVIQRLSLTLLFVTNLTRN